MDQFKDYFFSVVLDLSGNEFLKISADHELGIMEKLAPSTQDEKRLYYERKREEFTSKNRSEIWGILTDYFILEGFLINERFFVKTKRLIDGTTLINDNDLRVWYWTVAYPIGVINYNLSLLSDNLPIKDGIANDFAKYISGASDRVLTYIVVKHCLPIGADRPAWIGKTQDAARFAKIVGLIPSEFNTCFCGKRIDSNTFHPAKGLDGRREHELYFIIQKYLE